MFKSVGFILLVLFSVSPYCYSQGSKNDSLEAILKKSPEDTNKVKILLDLSRSHFAGDLDTSLLYSTGARDLATKLQYKKGIAIALKNIGIAYYYHGKSSEALDYWNESLAVFESMGDKVGIANIYNNIGGLYFDKSLDDQALEYDLKSLKIAEETGDKLRISTACLNIGNVYLNKKDTYPKALAYYLKALALAVEIQDLDNISSANTLIGETYYKMNKFETALDYFKQSLKTAEDSLDIAYTLNYLGKAYTQKKDYQSALQSEERAYAISAKLDSKLDITISLLNLGKTNAEMGNIREALKKYKEAEGIAIHEVYNNELKEIYEGMTNAYSKSSDYGNAFKYQTLLLNVKDVLYDDNVRRRIGTFQFKYEDEKKQAQVDLLTKDQEIQKQEIRRQKLMRNGFVGGFSVVLLFAGVFFMQRNRISKEKKRSDELLLNILPEETAEELKSTGTAKAKSFDLVTVMFTDFKNFTQASEKLSAEELVHEINLCYSEFDKIITKYGIEKIKTIGDAYMCAGGLPVTNQSHPFDVIKAGLEFQQFIAKNKKEREEKNLPFFELRLGIHTGPVVAGIVGIKKFAYDIWGDTVNTASRMESSGEIGKVNISETTYQLVKDEFNCVSRGKIKAKNKGEIEMYFVEGIRSRA